MGLERVPPGARWRVAAGLPPQPRAGRVVHGRRRRAGRAAACASTRRRPTLRARRVDVRSIPLTSPGSEGRLRCTAPGTHVRLTRMARVDPSTLHRIVHELRQPLGAIANRAYLLGDEALSAEGKKHVEA